ncbi:hypothetical protein ASG73_09925 [Janibacter sp. Soil728]|uniref:hypothetical protein n=1 Tax=Janibacter sp. Soil728 TaxID=1736393 RepID=UPI0006FD9AF0|nr:hypothetical protein [Janibacter sp. Soil728]KRE37917.1 hypothetical protein ASG73_09925 [Janibacter sp. Soil728]
MTHLESFGQATAWIAVLDRSQAEVAEALGLTGGRNVAAAEAVRASSATGLLPPLAGAGGRWTLAVSAGLTGISTRRLTTLTALLDTQVLFYDTVGDPAARDDVLARAAAESLDPRTLSGEVPGHAVLFDDVDEGPPPADLVKTPSRTPWLWTRLFRR